MGHGHQERATRVLLGRAPPGPRRARSPARRRARSSSRCTSCCARYPRRGRGRPIVPPDVRHSLAAANASVTSTSVPVQRLAPSADNRCSSTPTPRLMSAESRPMWRTACEALGMGCGNANSTSCGSGKATTTYINATICPRRLVRVPCTRTWGCSTNRRGDRETLGLRRRPANARSVAHSSAGCSGAM